VLVLAGCPRSTPPPESEPAQPPIAETPLPPSGNAAFKIGNLDWTRSEDGRELYLEGSVENVGTRASRDLKVWVDGLDRSGMRLARTEVVPTPQQIPPGGAARFVVRMPNDASIETFHVEAIGR
jgi:hypothetical protein